WNCRCPPGRARRDLCRSPPGSPARNPWLPTRTQATGDVRPRHSPTTPFVGPRTSSPPPDRRNRRASSERPNEVGLGDPSHGGGSLQATELAREDVGGPVPTDPRPRTSARRHPQRGTCSGGSLFSLDDLGPQPRGRVLEEFTPERRWKRPCGVKGRRGHKGYPSINSWMWEAAPVSGVRTCSPEAMSRTVTSPASCSSGPYRTASRACWALAHWSCLPSLREEPKNMPTRRPRERRSPARRIRSTSPPRTVKATSRPRGS